LEEPGRQIFRMGQGVAVGDGPELAVGIAAGVAVAGDPPLATVGRAGGLGNDGTPGTPAGELGAVGTAGIVGANW
jgi:hypothetical protein